MSFSIHSSCLESSGNNGQEDLYTTLLAQLGHCRKYAPIISWVNCCNMLYMGLSLKNIWKLQLIQKAVAQFSLWPWASNLHELHWLPMCFQVWFKVLVITHELLFDIGLGYLKNRLSFMVYSWPI